jgi:hypothetical protein
LGLLPVTGVRQTCAMEGLVLTFVLAIVMVAAIVLLGRSWPRSSRIGGYRARRDTGPPAAPGEPPVREEDDVRWDWTGDDGDSGPSPR